MMWENHRARECFWNWRVRKGCGGVLGGLAGLDGFLGLQGDDG